MFCTACGRQLAEGTGFCPACGTATSPSVVPPPGLYLQTPGLDFERIEAIDFFPLTLLANILGVGVREELTKAIPLFLVAYFTTRMKNPVMGMVLGMMSGIGFAITENVFYVFTNLSQAVGAVRSTGQVGHLV